MRSRFFPYGIYFNIILFLLVVTLSGLGIHVFRDILLRNARTTGMTLASNYAAEERSNLVVYETLLSFGTTSIDTRLLQGDSRYMMTWMKIFFDRVQTILGENVVSPYIILDGAVVDMKGHVREAFSSAAPTEQNWYVRAVAAPGKTIFTDVYKEPATGMPVVTVARKCLRSNAVLAFDLFPYNFKFHITPQHKDRRHAFFICDGNGTLLYKNTVFSYHDVKLQSYVNSLLQKIQNGDFESHTSYVIGLDGNRRSVYYSKMSNGWYTIVTVPHEEILQEADLLLWLFVLSTGIFLIVLLLHSWRYIRANRLMERVNETVRVLGDSYYALYRVNFIRETYETIKPSELVQQHLPQTGPYSALLQVLVNVIEPDAREEYAHNFSCESIRSLVSRRVRDFGGDFRRRFGEEYRWVSIRVLFDEKLTPEEVVLCFREVEQEKQQQLQERKLLQDSLESAQRNEKAKQAFFSNMSHDMRTPVNAIMGLSELAERFLDDKEKVRDYLAKIGYSSRQLKSLIDDILNMSRMEQGRMSMNNRVMDLQACIRDCLETYKVQADAEHKILKIDLDMVQTQVLGDPVRIVQLLNNLLSNAFKFTAEHGEISVSVSRAGEVEEQDTVKYRIVVSDTGTGISEDFLPHIFEPYTREVRFSAKTVAGTGLGMSITKNLVEQMNGEITVESELGRGTTFTIVLPFALAGKDSSPSAEARPFDEHPELLKGKRILLVEDNMVNMELAAEMLAVQGMEVSQAWNGKEAVQAFADSEPFYFDAVLMDMQMPEMDGCEATRAIRALNRPDARSILIIAVTANAFAEDIAATTAAGMNMHVAKPIDFKKLFQILQTSFAGRN